MVLCFVWLSSSETKPLEVIRRRVNQSIEKRMPLLDSFSFWHIDLEGGFSGLYRQDRVHLSDVGLDIFNLGLQTMIEMAALWGRPFLFC